MRRRCLCECHCGSVTDRRRADGVDVRDAIEAVVACSSCRNHHCAALLDPEIRADQAMICQLAPIGEASAPKNAILTVNGRRYEYDNGEFRPLLGDSPNEFTGEDGG